MSTDSPYDRQVRQVASLEEKNQRLSQSLVAARQQLTELRRQLAALSAPPGSYAQFEGPAAGGSAKVIQMGRRLRVSCGPEVNLAQLRAGQTVALNESMALVAALGFETIGDAVKLKDVLDRDRLLVTCRGEEELVARRAGPLVGVELRGGETLLLDHRSGFAFEVIAHSRAEDLILEDVPDVTYDDIGGLDKQIAQVRDAVELPFNHAGVYADYQLRAPKGVLLYGPPGCGKTLIAKAVARSLAATAGGQACFLNIKGPELLNKYVGETERHIRAIFARARDKAREGGAVVVFFDEMESLFRTRGSGVSSDVETTVVPQLLAEIDGVEALGNVIVIGASNREDMIDPAILRPGRLDVKVRIDRPDQAGAAQILSKYLLPSLPLDQAELARHDNDRPATTKAMIEAVTSQLYAEIDANQFLEVTYAGGDKEILFYKDFASGAMIRAVVDRAKTAAIKSQLDQGQGGLTTSHLLQALDQELTQNEDLPGTTNPDDWARVSGRKGEPIVYLRTLAGGGRHLEL
ncbi:MAG: proteasome ATPase [Micrococcales bacterium]|nr:proteasome ATPase [Micrococcales bacterium]